MPSPADSKLAVLKSIRRFRRNRRGSAAVEFAMVAPLFFGLLFAIIETGIMFLADQVLETVTQESARIVMTGQAQAAGYTQAQFQSTVVCPLIPAILSCANLYINVTSYPTGTSFLSVNVGLPDCSLSSMQYNPGSQGNLVIVQMYYQWQLYVTGLGLNLSNCPGSKRMLAATAAFLNEPY